MLIGAAYALRIRRDPRDPENALYMDGPKEPLPDGSIRLGINAPEVRMAPTGKEKQGIDAEEPL